MTWRCNGILSQENEHPDDYDLRVLDEQFAMLRPREHSAQVPADDREVIERIFKGESELLNTLVCTPTLEMGVDIGSLDAILMRNIPPLPANYWQRAGRAGRRHRMAVNLSYARSASHDRAYFNDPLRLLQGQISPPRLNLRNTLMVAKHVHAAVLTVLHQLARSENSLTAGDHQEIEQTLQTCFPGQVKSYLFLENGAVREMPLDVSPLTSLIQKHESLIYEHIHTAFARSWPAEDQLAVTEKALRSHIQQMGAQLNTAIQALWRRLQWAMDQIRRLNENRLQKGALDPDEDALFQRCDRLIKKLKGIQSRRRRETEGFDDTNTYGVLASEGFLPGYGLDIGTVKGTAQVPRSAGWVADFDLPRPSGVALREYSPGNLIYANGHRFVPRYYHLEPTEPIRFQVDIANEAISEIGTATTSMGLSASTLRAAPICDVDLPHQANISDEEDYRFQLPVTTLGYEQNRHDGGCAYTWEDQTVLLRRNVHLRLVNVGATSLVRSGELGYSICLVCGQSRSPFASPTELNHFQTDHQQRCGQRIEPTGFYADIVADTLCLQDCENREVAYSLMETIRHGATNILDMELDDLQILAIAHPGEEKVDILLYDPMPGGSGLLEQLMARWSEVIQAAIVTAHECPSRCDTACIDCLFTFRNAYFHRFLNRHTALAKLLDWGDILVYRHEIPPKLPKAEAVTGNKPTNNAEARLQEMLKRAGFPEPVAQKRIDLGKPLGTTIPDFFYDPTNDDIEGICIYLDGLSKHLHGSSETQQRDRAIREELRNTDYEVIEIPASNLDDQQAMAKYFYRLARLLMGKTQAQTLRDHPTWFIPFVAAEDQAGAELSLETFDPDLFDPQWLKLLEKLSEHPDVRIECGSDIAIKGKVIGTYAAQVFLNGSNLVLLDATSHNCQAMQNALAQKSQAFIAISPTALEASQQILHQLQEVN